MLRSKICLADVNVWIALATERHEYHASARQWFSSLEDEGVAFCRITQMGLLRLLTNQTVMANEVLDPRRAWDSYKSLRRDWRVTFAQEPDGMEEAWIDLMRKPHAGASWTDAYLAALALGHAYTLVSFDRGFERWRQLPFQLLVPGRA